MNWDFARVQASRLDFKSQRIKNLCKSVYFIRNHMRNLNPKNIPKLVQPLGTFYVASYADRAFSSSKSAPVVIYFLYSNGTRGKRTPESQHVHHTIYNRISRKAL